MNRYENIPCPICKKPLSSDDDIVVCPICGAPHHRACYMETGHCALEEQHAAGVSWQPPEDTAEKTKAAEKDCAQDEQICERCGEQNPKDASVCKTCGYPLNPSSANRENTPPFTPPFSQQDGMPPFSQGMPPFSPFMRTSTVSPDEDIDGIKAQDYATFVGRSAHYFLPRFKELSGSRARIINWSAFLFKGGYFLYRKMYGFGILVMLADVLLAVPQGLSLYQTMTSPTVFGSMGTTQPFTAAMMICEALGLALRFLCGFFGNTLYKRHCQKEILKIQESNLSTEEYRATLTKRGGVAAKLVTGLLIGYAALNMVAYFLLFFL